MDTLYPNLNNSLKSEFKNYMYILISSTSNVTS